MCAKNFGIYYGFLCENIVKNGFSFSATSKAPVRLILKVVKFVGVLLTALTCTAFSYTRLKDQSDQSSSFRGAGVHRTVTNSCALEAQGLNFPTHKDSCQYLAPLRQNIRLKGVIFNFRGFPPTFHTSRKN